MISYQFISTIQSERSSALDFGFSKMSVKIYLLKFVVLFVFLTCAFGEQTQLTVKNNGTELVETGRRHHGFGLHKWWGFYGLHALGVLYWLKVKAVIVAFIVGTAIVWGFKWYKGGGCSDIIHESPLITYDHGPAWSSGPHDHIPYSLDHNPFEHDHHHDLHEHEHFTSSDIVSDSLPANGPYSAYAGAYSDVPVAVPTAEGSDHKSRHRRQLDTEEQVSNIVFYFLGITNDGCRRRFICEMEFRSKANPFTRIAFGIVGRGLFSRYVNKNNANGRAASFRQCADVNPDCVLMEEDINDNEENEVLNREDEYSGRSLNLKSKQESKSEAQASSDPIVKGIFSRLQSTISK